MTAVMVQARFPSSKGDGLIEATITKIDADSFYIRFPSSKGDGLIEAVPRAYQGA